jgi:hypothetical protein
VAGLSLVLVGTAYTVSLDALTPFSVPAADVARRAAEATRRRVARRHIRADIGEGLSYLWHHDLIRTTTL